MHAHMPELPDLNFLDIDPLRALVPRQHAQLLDQHQIFAVKEAQALPLSQRYFLF